VAPKKTAPAIVSQLNEALNVALADTKFRERFVGEGFAVPTGQSAADFERSMARDRAMWRVVISEKGLTLE
jgi:tripartite-type tricarboxylate transporter receptor subunit TctC